MPTTFLIPKNNATSHLTSSMTIGALTLTLVSGGGAFFPTTYPFHISIEDEILEVSDNTADVLTVTRNAEGTSAATHVAGSVVDLNITAQAITDITGLFSAADVIPYATASGVGAGLTVAASRIVGKKSSGTLSALTGAEVMAILSGQAGAAFSFNSQEITSATLNASVAKGTWTASGTWTIPAVTLGGILNAAEQDINNVVNLHVHRIYTTNGGDIYFGDRSGVTEANQQNFQIEPILNATVGDTLVNSNRTYWVGSYYSGGTAHDMLNELFFEITNVAPYGRYVFEVPQATPIMYLGIDSGGAFLGAREVGSSFLRFMGFNTGGVLTEVARISSAAASTFDILAGKLTGAFNGNSQAVTNLNIDSGTLDGVTITAPVLNGTVTNTGTGLAMPAFYMNGDINMGVKKIIDAEDIRSDSGDMYLTGYKTGTSPRSIIIRTLNTALSGIPNRLVFSGGADVASASWTNCIQIFDATSLPTSAGVTGSLYYIAGTGVVMRSP